MKPRNSLDTNLDTDSSSEPERRPYSPVTDTWRLIVRSLALLCFFLVVSVGLLQLDLPYDDQAFAVIDKAGLVGVFVFVLAVDTFVVPATLDIVFPFTVDWNPVPLLATISVASVLGGIWGYWIGRLLYFLPFVRKTVGGYYERGATLLERYGSWAVVFAALTPLPFSTISWIAGMLHISFRKFALAALWRIPRVVGYWALLQAGLAVMG